MTSVIFSPSFSSASCFIFCRTSAEFSSGRYHLPDILISTPPEPDRWILYGSHFWSRAISGSFHLRPISRFIEKMVFSGLTTACRFAKSPTNRSPFLAVAAIEGVVLLPSLFSIIFGSPPSTIAIAEFVVPKSIPNIFAIVLFIYYYFIYKFLLLPASKPRLSLNILFVFLPPLRPTHLHQPIPSPHVSTDQTSLQLLSLLLPHSLLNSLPAVFC